MKLGLRISIVSGIPDSKAQDSRFHSQNFSDSGIRFTLHEGYIHYFATTYSFTITTINLEILERSLLGSYFLKLYLDWKHEKIKLLRFLNKFVKAFPTAVYLFFFFSLQQALIIHITQVLQSHRPRTLGNKWHNLIFCRGFSYYNWEYVKRKLTQGYEPRCNLVN